MPDQDASRLAAIERREVVRLIVEPSQDGRGIVGVWDVLSLKPERLAELRNGYHREFVYARDYDALMARLIAVNEDVADRIDERNDLLTREAATFAELLERRAEVQRLTADLAAAREENAKWSKCDSLVCPYEQRMREAESQLAAATEARERLKVWLQGEMAAASATINNTQPNGPTESFYAATGLHAAYRATLAKLSDAQRPVGPADKE